MPGRKGSNNSAKFGGILGMPCHHFEAQMPKAEGLGEVGVVPLSLFRDGGLREQCSSRSHWEGSQVEISHHSQCLLRG